MQTKPEFVGFNPQQTAALLAKNGVTGVTDPEEQRKLIASDPGLSAKFGQYAQQAQARIDRRLAAMQGAGQNVQPTQPAFAEGGYLTYTEGQDPYWQRIVDDWNAKLDAQAAETSTADSTTSTTTSTSNPERSTTTSTTSPTLDEAQKAFADAYTAYMANPEDQSAIDAFADAQSALQSAQMSYQLTEIPTGAEATGTMVNDPTSLAVTADVATIQPTNEQLIAAGTGQQISTPEATAATVQDPTQAQAVTADTQTAEAAARTEANTYDATTVSDKVEGTLEGLEAATADPSESATVQGQLEMLMADFEEGTPPWASGAMREASALMARRGMGASSMAGEAIVLAAMQAALPIASQDAQTWASFEMANLNNRQQTAIFKTQQRLTGLFSDQASENAAKQFNAQSKNQTDQFFASLETTVSQFNAAQINAISQFNAEQRNITDRFNVEQETTVDIFRAKQQDAINMFNAELLQQRDQFNAKNSLIIEQANTQWLQQVSTINTAEQNLANRDAAATANGLTTLAYNNILQTERDIMAFAYESGENAADRQLRLILADKELAIAREQMDAESTAAKYYTLYKLGFGS